MTAPTASKKMPPLGPGEFRFITKGMEIEPAAEGGKRRFKTIASSTIKDMGNDEMKLSALEDMVASFRAGLNIFTDHEHKVDKVFGRTDSADIRDSGLRDEKTGAPIYDLHIAGVVNEPDPRAVQLADSIDGGYVTFGTSIGAIVRQHQKNKSGGMDIYHVDAKEASLVGIPMNQRSWTYKAAKAAELLDAEGVESVEDDDEPEVVKLLDAADGSALQRQALSGAKRGNLSDSDFACPEKRKYPIHDKAHVRAALSRVGDPSNDQCGRDKIIAAARRMGIGDHKTFTDDELVTWAATEFPADQITDDEEFIIKTEDEAPDPEVAADTESAVNADGQESADEAPETPETASADSDQVSDTPTEEKEAGVSDDVKELLGHVAKMAAEIGRLREEIDAKDAIIATHAIETSSLAAEVGLAKEVIERVMATPLQPKTAGYVETFTKAHSLFAPDVIDFLSKRSTHQ